MICISSNPHFYCPSNLDLPAKLKEHGLEQWLGRDLWRLYYILTVIYQKRWLTDFDKRNFVEVNSSILQTVIHSRKARPALDALLKIGVIETDGHYRAASKGIDGKSRGYRFSKEYNFEKFRRVNEIDYSKVSKRLLNVKPQIEEMAQEHRYLFDCLQRVTIRDDAVGSGNPLMGGLEKDFFERKIEDIQNKEWEFSVGPITGRVFTTVTNLPRELRPYLRLDGKPLVEIDVSACQPLLLSQLYQPDENEKSKYLELVLSGNFYEALDAKLSKPYGGERRGELKEAVFIQIFFDRLRSEKSKLCQVFSELFPILYAKIVKLKTADYKALSHKLQRDEAEIMIKGVVREISERKIPVLTIHDSILTFAEHAEEVELLLKQTFYKRLKVSPNVKTTFHPENPFQVTFFGNPNPSEEDIREMELEFAEATF